MNVLCEGFLGLTQDRAIYLKCNNDERVFENKNGLHAEENMINFFKQKGKKLPSKIWIYRSPCEKCADKLKTAYREENPESPAYPTIHIGKIALCGSFKDFTRSKGAKCLIDLLRTGFNFETWDFREEHRVVMERNVQKAKDRLHICKTMAS